MAYWPTRAFDLSAPSVKFQLQEVAGIVVKIWR